MQRFVFLRKRMKYNFLNIFHSLLILCCTGMLQLLQAQVVVKEQLIKMGSVFDITVIDRDSTTAYQHIQVAADEIERIENLISEWRAHTQISEVNRNAGIRPVKVDREVYELTKRAIHYSKLTDGAFDISIAALDKVWVFDSSMDELPSEEAIRNSVRLVGYQNIMLDSVHSTIFLVQKGMKIGFGSIGKGYAADRGRAILQSLAVRGGIVNASGDLSAWGEQLDGEPWRIGVANPFKSHKMIKVLKLRNGSVATSGSNQKFAEIGSKRYAHIINPQTGWPASGLMSATVSGPSAEVANFLSTSVMVLGQKRGKRLMKRYPDYKLIVVKDK